MFVLGSPALWIGEFAFGQFAFGEFSYWAVCYWAVFLLGTFFLLGSLHLGSIPPILSLGFLIEIIFPSTRISNESLINFVQKRSLSSFV